MVPREGSWEGSAVAIVDQNGSRRTLATAKTRISWVRSSPDGSRLAYVDGGSTWVIDLDTGAQRMVADGAATQWLDDVPAHPPVMPGVTRIATVAGRGQTIGRRLLLVQAARGVLGIAVLGACTADRASDGASSQGLGGSADGLAWRRVDLAYVSAYILVRGGDAAVVDVGYPGVADRIGAALAAAGTGWDRVRDVVITHAHGDHFGSLEDVADRAAFARLHVGAADLEEIRNFLPIEPGRAGGPGGGKICAALAAGGRWRRGAGHAGGRHTGPHRGHIAVFDADSAVLVAGDALTNTIDGTLGGSLAFATWDQGKAQASVRKLAALEPRIILVGHGPAVEHDAALKLRRLASAVG